MTHFFYVLNTLDHTMLKLCIFMTTFLMINCSNKSATENSNDSLNEIKRFKALNDETEPSKDTLPFDKIEYVFLETKSECLIDMIIGVQFRDSLIFILDGSNNLFVFERNGRYKAKIGNRGQGPQDYLKISSFFIDDAKQNAVITDDFKNVFLYYDFNGNFIQKKDMPVDIMKLVNKSSLIGSNRLIFNYILYNDGAYYNENMGYQLFDVNNLKVLDKKSYSPVTAVNIMFPLSVHPITETEKGVNFIMPLCDTIYSCHNDKFQPEYIIEHKQKMAPKDKYILGDGPDRNTYTSLALKFEKDGFFTGFNGIYETDNHILLTYICSYYNSCFLANKKKQEGRYYVLGEIDEDSKNIPLFREIIGCYKNTFICTINMLNLPYYKDVLSNNRNKGMTQFKTIVESIEEDDNPVLIIYTLNENY